jgi:hypothetical protein
VQRTLRDQINLADKQRGELVGELLDLPAQFATGAECAENVDVTVGRAVPRAWEPKTSSLAIPYLSQMSARRSSSTSDPAIISMIPG